MRIGIIWIDFSRILMLLMLPALALAQMKPLYNGPIPYNGPKLPEEKRTLMPDGTVDSYTHVSVPAMERFEPSKEVSRNQAVLVIPGGGNSFVSYANEGVKVSKWLASKGYTAFALKYRLPDSASQTQTHWVPLTDAATALAAIRASGSFTKVGVIGFSAGGHLAGCLSNLTDTMPNPPKGAKPDFAILVYPVISLGPSAHSGTFRNLFSRKPPEDVMALFSLETRVTAKTPPTLIIHSQNDNIVPVENALLYYRALTRAGIPAEMHLYPDGGHGYNLGEKVPGAKSWPDEALSFMNRLK